MEQVLQASHKQALALLRRASLIQRPSFYYLLVYSPRKATLPTSLGANYIQPVASIKQSPLPLHGSHHCPFCLDTTQQRSQTECGPLCPASHTQSVRYLFSSQCWELNRGPPRCHINTPFKLYPQSSLLFILRQRLTKLPELS